MFDNPRLELLEPLAKGVLQLESTDIVVKNMYLHRDLNPWSPGIPSPCSDHLSCADTMKNMLPFKVPSDGQILVYPIPLCLGVLILNMIKGC